VRSLFWRTSDRISFSLYGEGGGGDTCMKCDICCVLWGGGRGYVWWRRWKEGVAETGIVYIYYAS